MNGKEALDRLLQSPADAIVLDLMMPVMDGWEFVRQDGGPIDHGHSRGGDLGGQHREGYHHTRGRLYPKAVLIASGEIDARVELIRDYQSEAHVIGNETRLGQVFLNLLVNAAQAIPKDQAEPRRITVAVRSEAMWAIVEVRDTGRGMSSAQKERIFEPFFTTKSGRGGTGLGLAIAEEIVETHGGTLEVASELGRGSFTVRLPAAP